jgi:hypothetical protein
MDIVHRVVSNPFPRMGFPSVKNYLVFSSILFFSGFYYYYRIVQSLGTNSKVSIFIFYKMGLIGVLHFN